MALLKGRFIAATVLIGLLVTAVVRGVFQQLKSAHIYGESRFEKHQPEFKLTNEARQRGLTHQFECFTADSSNVNVVERLCRANAAVAIADLDNNGQYFVFLNTMKEGHSDTLYKYQNGHFIDVTKGSGLEFDLNNEAPTVGAIFFDYDNDGKKDLLVLKAGCQKLYKNIGDGRFIDVSIETGMANICSNAMAVSALDYDRDGFLDIYIGGFFRGTSLKNLKESIMPDGLYFSDNGPNGILLHNQKGQRFVDTTKEMGLAKAHHTWAIAVSDLNHDGYPDLFLANDHGPSAIYSNQAGIHFEDVSARSGIQKSGRFGMCADVTEFRNQGYPDIYVSDVSLLAISASGGPLWRFSKDGSAVNLGANEDVQHCGWSWGCKFVDLNRDGIQDLFLTSGYWNLGNTKQYIYPLITINSLPSFLQRDQNLYPNSSLFAHTPSDENCVFQREANGRFEDVAIAVGANQAVVGKGVATWDFENDGSPGVLIATSEGSPILYRNTPLNFNHWVGFKLKTKFGNPDAWGSVAHLAGSNTSQYRELYPANGFKSQSDERLFFGLGPKPDQHLQLDITWPDGRKQNFTHFEIDRYNLIQEVE